MCKTFRNITKKEIFMASATFSQKLNDARLMVAGIKSNIEALKGIGMSEEDATALETALGKTTDLNIQQEKLKADLKTCTASLEDSLKTLNALVSAAKKRVKIVIPQTSWKEFGIADKK